ncbi:uncharacterized protein LOC120754224 [Hirundo rustica]|uniref:uncharacterized protein LOC120754224 n=1 Tax=Hirundo rustica TaxID=43150 RepID=UPI001A9406D0|nr:uncharacterized protein LOC120754224 [Hirundo rustica]
MECEFAATLKLFIIILSERRKTVAEKVLQKLINWAHGNGHLTTPRHCEVREALRDPCRALWPPAPRHRHWPIPGSSLPACGPPPSLRGSGSIVPAAPQQQAGRGESGPREPAPAPAAPSAAAPTAHAPSAPPFSAVPEETPVDQERGTRDPCCRPPSPDNVPLPDELEEDPVMEQNPRQNPQQNPRLV